MLIRIHSNNNNQDELIDMKLSIKEIKRVIKDELGDKAYSVIKDY